MAACVSGVCEERRLRASIQPLRRPACCSSDRQRRARQAAVCYASQPAQDPQLVRGDAQTKARFAARAQTAQLNSGQQPRASEPESGAVPAAPATSEGIRSWDDGDARPAQQWASGPALRDAFSRPSHPARTGGPRPASGDSPGGSQRSAEASPANDAGGTSVGSVISNGNSAAGSTSGTGSFSAQVRGQCCECAPIVTTVLEVTVQLLAGVAQSIAWNGAGRHVMMAFTGLSRAVGPSGDAAARCASSVRVGCGRVETEGPPEGTGAAPCPLHAHAIACHSKLSHGWLLARSHRMLSRAVSVLRRGLSSCTCTSSAPCSASDRP